MGQAALAPRQGPPPETSPPKKSSPQKPAAWYPDTQAAQDIQGIVVSAYFHLPHAAFVLLELDAPPVPSNGAPSNPWLRALQAQVTNAAGRLPEALNIAFTAHGLRCLGLSEPVLATFSPAFRDGMAARARLLGDENEQAPAKWRWNGGGLHADRQPAGVPTVGAAALVYAQTEGALQARLDALQELLAKFPGVRLAAPPIRSVAAPTPHMDPRTGIKTTARREHFGFADGLSQPVLMHGASAKLPDAAWGAHGIPVGDVVLGHPNTYDVPAPGPLVPAVLDPAPPLLLPAPAPGLHDLGCNGSYLVLRQLEQDVAGFWQSMAKAARDLTDKAGTSMTSEGLAERVVGRTRDGDVLVPGGVMPRDPARCNKRHGHPDPANSFGFRKADADGAGCPIGAHVRRANPRDSLAPEAGDEPMALHAVNRHRILRRGRPYGPAPADRMVDDGIPRGLVFACLNSDIERQFEFVQHTWIGNDTFGGLYQEADPLIGPPGRFTIPNTPIRQCAHLARFVTILGGGYFFLPSLHALRYLAGRA